MDEKKLNEEVMEDVVAGSSVESSSSSNCMILFEQEADSNCMILFEHEADANCMILFEH